MTLGMIGCSIASEIWHFYLLFGVVIAIGNCLSGGPQFAPILARWFVKKRGTAIGLASSGVGFWDRRIIRTVASWPNL